MDYENKYNELVAAIKQLRDINPSDEVIQNWVNDNVPELNETEDERVSKDIIHFLEENKKRICVYHENSVLDCWIEWIRKQCNKEVNKETTETYSEWDKEDKLHLTNAIIAAQSVWGNDSRTYNWLESLKNRVFPKTKCDWSEEDEKMLDSIIKDFGLGCTSTKRQNLWLKSIRPQNQWKPTKEQMEALEIAITFVTDDFDECPTLSERLRTLKEQLEKLK